MQNITTIDGLKDAIQALEVEQTYKGMILKEQFNITYESLKPVNILRNALKEFTATPDLVGTILGAATGMLTGYFSKKLVVGASANIFRKLLGSVLQVGVTKLVAQHPNTIKTLGQFIFQRIFQKKEQISS